MSFTNFIKEQEDLKNQEDFNEFLITLDFSITSLENCNESFLTDISDKFKDAIVFIKELASILNFELKELFLLFKNKFLFDFFKKLSWSISSFVSLIKQGYKLQKSLHQIIAKFISDNKIVKFTNEKLKVLDEFLNEHPLIKKSTSLIVVGFLIYQWTQMISFTGDIEFDFDQTVLFDAIKGNFSLADLFATEDGIKMLMFISIGVLTGITFPWPGDTWVLFALSIVYTICKDKYPIIAKNLIKNVKKYKSIKL